MKKITIEILCTLFALLLLYAAISKIIDYKEFLTQLKESPLSRFASLISWLTPLSEIVISLLIFIPHTKRLGLYAFLLLMTGFTFYIIYLLEFNPDVSCNCGGLLEEMTWKQHLLFNTVFIVFAGLNIYLYETLYKNPKDNYQKKRIKFTITATIIITIISILIYVPVIGSGNKYYNQNGSPLPNFTILLADSIQQTNTKAIKENVPIVLMYFRPTCKFCYFETVNFIKNMDSLKNIQFVLLTNKSVPKKQLLDFKNSLQLNKFNNITVGYDQDWAIKKYYNPKGLPDLYIFNSKKELIFKAPYPISVKEILSITKENA